MRFAITGVAAALVSSSLSAAPPAALNYPLAIGTKWTYHMHQENAPGVRFSPEDAPMVHGSALDCTLVSEVKARERLGAAEYARVESTRDGKAWMTEWYRMAPEGLILGKRIVPQDGVDWTMEPPQRILTPMLRRGDSWIWRGTEPPVTFHRRVVGPASVTVPAGSYESILVDEDSVIQDGGMRISSRIARYFVDGVGFVSVDSKITAGARPLTVITSKLEKFGGAQQQ